MYARPHRLGYCDDELNQFGRSVRQAQNNLRTYVSRSVHAAVAPYLTWCLSLLIGALPS